MKGIVFTIEAVLSLAIALIFVSYAQPALSGGYGALKLYQVAQDVAEVSVKNKQTVNELNAFLEGSLVAKKSLEEKYSRISRGLGYCVEIDLDGKKISANCFGSPSMRASAERIFFDGNRFVVLSAGVGTNYAGTKST